MTPDENKIMWLLSIFDNPRASFFNSYYRNELASWKPETQEEKDAFRELTSASNRIALRAWYSRLPAINPAAEAFRQILRTAVNEELPLNTRLS